MEKKEVEQYSYPMSEKMGPWKLIKKTKGHSVQSLSVYYKKKKMFTMDTSKNTQEINIDTEDACPDDGEFILDLRIRINDPDNISEKQIPADDLEEDFIPTPATPESEEEKIASPENLSPVEYEEPPAHSLTFGEYKYDETYGQWYLASAPEPPKIKTPPPVEYIEEDIGGRTYLVLAPGSIKIRTPPLPDK